MPNDDLISRKALGISRCNPDVFNDRAYGEGWNACIDMIEAAPAVDAAPVVHSTYYLHHREDFSAPPCECNNCHCEFTVDDVKEDCHYCPKCGAKLDGEEPACGPDYCEIGGEDDEK